MKDLIKQCPSCVILNNAKDDTPSKGGDTQSSMVINSGQYNGTVANTILVPNDGIVKIKVNGPGNAVLSYTRGGTILWNYHIWVTSNNPFINFYNTGGNVNGSTAPGVQAEFMDRNLGALAATTAKPADVDAYKYFGVMYQHGRPTPFSGQGVGTSVNVYTNIYNGAATKITKPVGSGQTHDIGGYTQNTTAVSSVTSAIQTPNTYYYEVVTNWTWYKFSDISLWSDYGTNKSIYDPCPYGHRVPINGSWNGFKVTPTGQSLAIDAGSTWEDASNKPTSWWPAAGLRHYTSGTIGYVGNLGYYWSSTYASTYYSYYLGFSYGGNVAPSNSSNRSYGLTVRCVQEERRFARPPHSTLCCFMPPQCRRIRECC